MKLVAIVDYGMCSQDSVARAVEECGGKSIVLSQAWDLYTASHIILHVGFQVLRNLLAI